MSKAKNEKTINAAFRRLQVRAFDRCREGMIRILREAVVYALEIHDMGHQRHLETGDSYGWGLWHNGKLIEISVTAKEGPVEGDTNLMLSAYPVPSLGWVGVVMAGMKPQYYFATQYENEILTATAQMVLSNFLYFFQPI